VIGSGARLQLLVGSTVPTPAPYPVMDALVGVEVTNNDNERDGFQMTFSLGKESLLDYGLLREGYLDPPNRVIVAVSIGVSVQTLIDGVITHHQVVPSNRPGDSTLYVTGEDISLRLDLEEKKADHKNQSDSDIVENILGYPEYVDCGLNPDVTRTTSTPTEAERVPTQQGTDLDYVRRLAQRNGFVFYIEPAQVPGTSTAYWGPENRLDSPQPPLTMNMGSDTNVDSPITFRFNALGPAAPQVTVVDPLTRTAIPIPIPAGLLPSLSGQPAGPLRKSISQDTANLDLIQAALRALSVSSESSSDVVTATGELDAVRYGRALRSRRKVGVRGVGSSYGGDYYVKQVTHRIRRGEYKQSFTLTREGLGALTSRVGMG
jgi:hypothetical protein